jgi:DNA-binding response OmpR family regulator
MHADITKVRQSLFNLLSNASKFTEQGKIKFKVKRYVTNDREWIGFQVSDTGIGMTPEQMNKLFQAFTQADASTTRKYGGTGLGLAITKKFCQMMGGDIKVASEFNRGSTFTIQIPLKVEKIIEKPKVNSSEKITLDVGKNTILAIDDDPIIHDLLKRFLTKQGFNVITATNGTEGLRLAREIEPNAITLDVMMPGMDGWAILTALKANPKTANIPVVMITMMEEQNLGYALGASDYLVKPIDQSNLRTVLAKYNSESTSKVVLLVENDLQTREILRRQLEKENSLIIEASNEEKALEAISAHNSRTIQS